MRLLTSIDETRALIREEKMKGHTVGFVPTMGSLHDGHVSLIKRSAKENDITVVSIFVNPIQFDQKNDFKGYPTNIEKDSKMAENAGAQILFCPDAAQMYPENFGTYIHVEEMTKTLCGASRPGHFRGVATIVLKLFNIILPDRAYFGQKDAQQVAVIEKMVTDLNCDLEIVECAIVREKDGLAMSSRNVFLSDEERSQASVIWESLNMAKEMFVQGERDSGKIKEVVNGMINKKVLANIAYVSIVDLGNFKEVDKIEEKALLAVAVKFGETRLIDNIVL